MKFTQAAFKNPFQYLDRDETADDVKQYALYLTRSSSINPGFRVSKYSREEKGNLYSVYLLECTIYHLCNFCCA